LKVQLNQVVVPHDVEHWHSRCGEQLVQTQSVEPLCLLRGVETVGTTQQIAGQNDGGNSSGLRECQKPLVEAIGRGRQYRRRSLLALIFRIGGGVADLSSRPSRRRR
jgi:hypothetical protein